VKRKTMLLLALLLAISISACAPTTPASHTPTVGPTSPAAVQPTSNSNFKATEAVIISHIFATMTASAPTPMPPPPVQPASTSKSATATPRPRATATTKPANTVPPPPPSAPKPTTDPYRDQITKGNGGILVVNYIGDHDATFTVAGQVKTVKSNDKVFFVVPVGHQNFSVSIPGVTNIKAPPLPGTQITFVNGSGWSDTLDVPADDYITFPLALNPNP
jgi:hypothetical protein